MFTDYLKIIYENEELKTLALKHFSSTIQNWHKDCPEETAGINADEFNEKELTLDCFKIKKAGATGHTYKIEAKYFKQFKNNIKAIYILKFYDDLTVYDDVFYIEK